MITSEGGGAGQIHIPGPVVVGGEGKQVYTKHEAIEVAKDRTLGENLKLLTYNGKGSVCIAKDEIP